MLKTLFLLRFSFDSTNYAFSNRNVLPVTDTNLLQLATAIQMAPNTLPAIQQLEIASVRRITKDERVIVVR